MVHLRFSQMFVFPIYMYGQLYILKYLNFLISIYNM